MFKSKLKNIIFKYKKVIQRKVIFKTNIFNIIFFSKNFLTVLMFDVDVLVFLSAYFGGFSAYFDHFKCVFNCIFHIFKCITIRSLLRLLGTNKDGCKQQVFTKKGSMTKKKEGCQKLS